MPRATRKRRGQKTKKTRAKATRARATRAKAKRQIGGFYPSVFEGVRNASILTPLVLRQAYRMFSDTRKAKKTKK
jgi:hypothetical protein